MIDVFGGVELVVVLAMVLTACPVVSSRPNPDHCWNAEGDATCRARFGDARGFCTRDTEPCHASVEFGCVDARPSMDECYSPCGHGASFVDDASCSIDDSSTTDDSPTAGDSGPAMASALDLALAEPEPPTCEACPASLPNCWAGHCVECASDADCPGLCDADHECQACTNHDQCPGGAGCDWVKGECLPSDRVLHVGNNQHSASFAEAMAELAGSSGTLIVHSQNYGESVDVVGGQTLVVRGVGSGLAPRLYDDGIASCVEPGSYGFEVLGRLYVEHMELRGDGGVRVTGGEVHLERTQIIAMDCHAALCVDGWLESRNSMLTSSDLALAGDAVLVPGPGVCALSITDSSLFSYHGATLACASQTLQPGSSVRNTLHYAVEAADLACPGELDTTGLRFAADATWFSSPASGDLHLTFSANFAALALAHDPGDPLFDFDGEPRLPSNFAGADVLVP